MNVFIRYEGFVAAATNRLYNFTVNIAGDEARHFTVSIPPELFVTAQLKFQDGPSISLQRLKEELDQETENSPAETQLTISGSDIEIYLLTQHPNKAAKKKRLSPYMPADAIGSS